MNAAFSLTDALHDVQIPETPFTRRITEFVREIETDLLFHHSSRVYYFGALAGRRQGLEFDAELLYAGAMFHDVGLVPGHSSETERFEVDGANAARDFLRSERISPHEIDTVWTAIALHTTPGIPQHMHPVIALLTAGVEMDVLGMGYAGFSDAERNAVVETHPRDSRFKTQILDAFYDGIHHKPATTFGNVKGDVLARKDPSFQRANFCSIILSSPWPGP